MAKFDIDKVVWSRNGNDLPEGTWVLFSDSLDRLKEFVEKNEFARAGVVIHSKEPVKGKTSVIDLCTYLGHKLDKTFIYPISKELDRNVNKYILRAIKDVGDDIKITDKCREQFAKEGMPDYADKAIDEGKHIIDVLAQAYKD